jgi:hypothetical protein
MQDACEICVKLAKKLVANTLPLLAHFRAKAAALLLPSVKDLFTARNQRLIWVAHHLCVTAPDARRQTPAPDGSGA